MSVAPCQEVAPGSAAWWIEHEQRQVRRPRKAGLSTTAIVQAALAIVQREGADALTMRRVADDLRTGAASLYRYVASRDELTALVVDHVLGSLAGPPSPEDGWRPTFASAARRFRSHLLAHLEVVPLIRSAQMLGPNSMVGREAALSSLLELGVAPSDAVAAYLATIHFTVANVQLHIRAGADDDEARRRLHDLFASQDRERFPNVADHARSLAEHTSEAEFEFGLAALLDRIEMLAGPQR